MRKRPLLVEAARILRKDMTPQEKHLWFDFLRHYPVKIYKQKIINDFIADFYCAKAMLIIELDGNQHYTEDGLAHDAERTNVLNALGFLVIRFPNSEIDNNFSSVCNQIDNIIQTRIKVPMTSPSRSD
ncbi:endonuclease domain-containing protein [bacterium]|nr:endonuclease domain-containing protein [bacterium]